MASVNAGKTQPIARRTVHNVRKVLICVIIAVMNTFVSFVLKMIRPIIIAKKYSFPEQFRDVSMVIPGIQDTICAKYIPAGEVAMMAVLQVARNMKCKVILAANTPDTDAVVAMPVMETCDCTSL